MSILSVFEFKGQEIRVAGTASAPTFCLLDVCKILDLSNPSMVKERLKGDGLSSSEVIDSMGRTQEALFISESNLYRCIFQSRKEEAEKFQDWVVEQVLPSIRQTGSYSQPQITPDHITAYNFDRAEFQPWKNKNPIAADIFLQWQGLTAPAIAPSGETQTAFALPAADMQDALSNAFLNLNRSGLAMNKLFKFVDRIPTMQKMDSKAFQEMQEALTEAGETIHGLQDDLRHERNRSESLSRNIQRLEETIAHQKQMIVNLKNRTTSSPVTPTAQKVPKDDTKGAKMKRLPSA